MKSAPYLAVLSLFVLSSCSSAYKTTQTPDDVYYSPRVQPTYATSNNNASYTETEDGGTYVNYDDDQGDYARRVTLFNDNSYNGGFYDYYGTPGIYSGMYANPYYGSSFGLGFGYGYPYFGSRFSLGFGYGWGSPWGYGGFYDPFFSPWYGYGYGYGYPYHYGGYYGGYYGHNYYSGYTRRAPRNSFGSVSNPNNARVSRSTATSRRSVSDDSYYTNGRSGAVNPNRGAEGGRRVNTTSNTYQPRRSYSPASGERTTTVDNNGGRTAVGGRTYQPAQQQSTRSYSPPTRSYSPPTRSYSQPSYSPSPSRGGGGGSFGGGGGGGRASGGRGRN